jgi:hypothetical protein
MNNDVVRVDLTKNRINKKQLTLLRYLRQIVKYHPRVDCCVFVVLIIAVLHFDWLIVVCCLFTQLQQSPSRGEMPKSKKSLDGNVLLGHVQFFQIGHANVVSGTCGDNVRG